MQKRPPSLPPGSCREGKDQSGPVVYFKCPRLLTGHTAVISNLRGQLFFFMDALIQVLICIYWFMNPHADSCSCRFRVSVSHCVNGGKQFNNCFNLLNTLLHLDSLSQFSLASPWAPVKHFHEWEVKKTNSTILALPLNQRFNVLWFIFSADARRCC